MDQKTRTNSFTTFQTPTAVTCQIFTSLTTSAIVTPSSSNFIQLTSSNLRPITNYTLVAGSQVPITHQYVVQSTARAIGPQYVNTGNVRHILSSSSQPTNVSYVLPSGAHIVRMNNVTTNTIASESQQNTQFVLTSSAHKANPSIISPLGPQSLKNPISTAVDNNLPRTIGITTSTTPILQRSGINIPKLNSAYYSQVKGNEAPKIALRPKLKEQKAGTSFILATNSTNRTKSVPISSLQKINTNFMQIPFIQKSGTVLSTNTIRSNVDNQHQKSQHQSVRSVILPSNFRNATVTSQQGTDCKLVLNSVNIPTQVLNANDNRPSTSSIQSLNTNYMQVPISQKSGTILTRGNLQPNIENNIRIGQQHPTIRSVILPAGYRPMVSSQRRGVDYRFILKPVLKNMPSPRYPFPRNSSEQNASPRLTSQSIHPTPRPTRCPLPRPSDPNVKTEIIASNDITPIPLRIRTSQLIISEDSVQTCIDEINKRKRVADNPPLSLDEPAIQLVQIEVTFKLFHLIRECKKAQVKSRSNILTEDCVRQICTQYYDLFYGNKLWPLFCSHNDEEDENKTWMRKHNNVNLLGWVKHSKFQKLSYIKKRFTNEFLNFKLKLPDKLKTSEVMYESMPQLLINKSETFTKKVFQSMKNNQVSFNSSALPKDKDNDEKSTQKINMDLDLPQANQIPSILLHSNK